MRWRGSLGSREILGFGEIDGSRLGDEWVEDRGEGYKMERLEEGEHLRACDSGIRFVQLLLYSVRYMGDVYIEERYEILVVDVVTPTPSPSTCNQDGMTSPPSPANQRFIRPSFASNPHCITIHSHTPSLS